MSGLSEHEECLKIARETLLLHLKKYGYLSSGHYHYGMAYPLSLLVDEGVIVEVGRDKIRGGTIYKPTSENAQKDS